MKETRSLRVAKINPFLQSNGIILKGNFILTFLVIFELILTLVLFVDYKFYSYPNKDIFETLNQISGDIYIINRYFILHYIDNFIIATFNSYISDIRDFSYTIPYFHEYIIYDNFEISFEGYIEIVGSLIITFILFLLTILQIRDQQRYRTVGLHSVYSPILLIVFSYLLKDFLFLKRVIGIKRDMLSPDKKISVIELFFSKSTLYKENEVENLDLKIETKQIFFGFYNFYRYSITKKSAKSKKS